MKCISKDGKIVRVEDDKAEDMVTKGYQYVKKSEWKAYKKGNKDVEIPVEAVVVPVAKKTKKAKKTDKARKSKEVKEETPAEVKA